MKKKRQAALLSLIEQHAVNTQEELQGHLQKAGFPVTQATVSRDIKELRLVKTLAADGTYRYSAPPDQHSLPEINNNAILRQAVKRVDFAQNIAAVKCRTGMANAACAVIDAIEIPGVVGTLAGDDTIFILLKNEEHAAAFAEELRRLYK